jgi:hypothetical protein
MRNVCETPQPRFTIQFHFIRERFKWPLVALVAQALLAMAETIALATASGVVRARWAGGAIGISSQQRSYSGRPEEWRTARVEAPFRGDRPVIRTA